MKEFKIDDLKAGGEAASDYYGPDGKVLIKAGAALTEALLTALSRRQIKRLFLQEEGEDIKKLLKLQDLEFDPLDDLAEGGDGAAEAPPPPAERVLPALAGVGKGEAGLRQMLESKPVAALEQAIESQRVTFAVKPTGIPLSDQARSVSFGDRTNKSKNGISEHYDSSIKAVKRIFSDLRRGELDHGKNVLRVVKGFVHTFLNDRHMLMNLANVKSKESDYLYAHSANTCLLAISIAASQGYNRDQILDIGTGALLHDVGALFIPSAIRFKPASLTGDELYEVRKHPMVGIHVVEKIRGLSPAAGFVCYQCHERENKKGYPKGRGGRLIHDFAKIVAVADLYESLTAGRPYRAPLVPYKAMEMLLMMVKEGYFDSGIVKFFLDYASLFPVGSLVKLSTGETGKVIQANRGHYAKPVVTVIVSAGKKLLSESEFRKVDLLKQNDVKITQPVDNAKLNIGVMEGF